MSPTKGRPPNKRQPPRRGPHAPKPQPYQKGTGGKRTTHGQKGKPVSRGAGQTRSPNNSGCGKKSMFPIIPFLILATIFYALPRLALDTYRERRRGRRDGL